MRFLKTSALTLTIMVGSVSVFAQSANEIVQKYISAIGGTEAWKKVNTMKMTGAISAQGMEMPITLTAINGKAMRVDMTIMGMANYMIITPKEGWSYFPVQGQTKAEPMTADAIGQMQDQLDVQGELVDYSAKGKKIEYVGKDDVDGTETFKLKLTDKDGKEKTLYFDASNYYLIREVQKIKADGKEMESITNYSNYQKLPEGITVAMSIESDNGPMNFKSIEVNPKVDESIFKPAN